MNLFFFAHSRKFFHVKINFFLDSRKFFPRNLFQKPRNGKVYSINFAVFLTRESFCLRKFLPLKVTSAIKHRNTAEEIIIYTHRVYSLLLKLERNKV